MCFKSSSASVPSTSSNFSDSSPSVSAEEILERARESRSTGSVRPVARGQSQKRSLIERGMMAVRYPTGRG
jgi:hypothetical protein